MSYKFNLPNENGQPVGYETINNSLIIIGANGSGKSKLGAWMEKRDMQNVHRVGAQRSLIFGDFIQLKSYEQSENMLLYGQEKVETSKYGRWQSDKFTTIMLNDYENVLSALLAQKNKQHDEFVEKCKIMKSKNQTHCDAPYTNIDRLQKIWNLVFPQRQIKFDDAKVTTTFTKMNGENIVNTSEYKGNEMSDGERVALYLIAQCLCVSDNKTLIIDEPEIHLHRSIMNKLWTLLENERQDCLFIYITHDTQFAAIHSNAKKIWVKSYDGANWEWEEIKDSSLPEQLMLDILGNRKPVLFVEGSADSYDTKLYSELYKDYYIVPCGSCNSVISRTKAMRESKQLHHLEAYGIIDRDFRSEYEIEKYKEKGIYTLQVAEVENLFLTEEVLIEVNNHLQFTDSTRIESVKNYIIKDRFEKQINSQICEAVVANIKYKLSVVEISKTNEIQAKQALEDLNMTLSYEDIKEEKTLLFNKILKESNYKDVLAVFNAKSLSSAIGHYFDMDNKNFCNYVIRLLSSANTESIANAFTPYLPSEILR